MLATRSRWPSRSCWPARLAGVGQEAWPPGRHTGCRSVRPRRSGQPPGRVQPFADPLCQHQVCGSVDERGLDAASGVRSRKTCFERDGIQHSPADEIGLTPPPPTAAPPRSSHRPSRRPPRSSHPVPSSARRRAPPDRLTREKAIPYPPRSCRAARVDQKPDCPGQSTTRPA